MSKQKKLAQRIWERTVSEEEICIWYLGQEGFAMKSSGGLFLVDPYLTDSIDRSQPENQGFQRKYPSPATPEELQFVDGVFCTHDHQDHLDPESISGLKGGNARFCVPKPAAYQLLKCGVSEEKQVLMEEGKAFSLPGVRVVPVAAAHDKLEQKDGAYCALSYVFQFENGITIFHGGDMVVYPELEEKVAAYHPQIVMLPINGRCYYREHEDIVGNTSFTEAADFAAHTKAQMLIPMHYDLYDANGENPAYLMDYLSRKYPEMQVHFFRPGEAMTLNRQDWE